MESDAALGCCIEVSAQEITNKNLSSDKFVRYGEKSASAYRRCVVCGDRWSIGDVTRLSLECPLRNGFSLRRDCFGETNWRHDEFITDMDFEAAWGG